jgi:isopenicillin-N epimerase
MRTDLGWKLDPTVTFLNHGSYGACPEPVLAAQRTWRDRMEAEPVRFMERVLPEALAEARLRIGAFLGADPAGLAFVPNATTGVNTILRSLHFEAGDELLTTDHEYNATLNALQAIADRDGARVVMARIPLPIADRNQALDAIVAAVTPRTRLALISHITSPTALVLPIEAIVGALDAHGVDTLVDAAHAPGMVPVDLDSLGAAYWTGNGHKWLSGPKGSAVLWVRGDRRERIHPLVVSHGANEPLEGGEGNRRERFRLEFDWTGTADPTAPLALADAIGWMATLDPGGWPAVMAANRALALSGRDMIAAALGVELLAPDEMTGSMAALSLPGSVDDTTARALQRTLTDLDGIQVPIMTWPVRAARSPGTEPAFRLIRISAQRYNEPADYERLAEALPRRLAAE